MNSILLVEDDTGIASFMKLELTHEGYSVDTAEDGRSGLELFEAKQYQLVLLDIMLPVLNGIEVLRRIRKISTVPVILVSARSETTDAVTGLDSGADDYITKPFAIEELLARIRSALRRNNFTGKNPEAEQSSIIIRNIEIDTNACLVYKDGKEIPLTRTEYMLLLYLAQNKGKTLSREQIIDFVWGQDHYIDCNSVDVYVRFLRTKLDPPADGKEKIPSIIKTMRGIGYCIMGD